jgi:hypothetical protein
MMEYKPVDVTDLTPDYCGSWICAEELRATIAEIDFLRKALAQAYDLTGMTATEDGWVVDSHDSGNTAEAYPDLYEWCVWRQMQNPVVIIPEPSDSEPKASSTGENGRSQEAADGGKAVMEGED